MIKQYILNILISVDQLVNTLFGGDPDETISSRLGKYYKSNEMRKIVDWFFGRDHCKDNIEEDEGKDSVIK